MAASPPPFYSPDTLNADNSVGLLMRLVLQSLLSQMDRGLLPHDLTHAQWVPLFRLAKGDCGTVAELARDASLDPGAMTRALDRLVAKGLVRRERSEHDRRLVQIALTDAGRAAATLVPAVLCEVMNAHLSDFSPAEWQQLLGFLHRMAANGAARAITDPVPNPSSVAKEAP